MIYGRIKDALTYRGIHPGLDLALSYIRPNFLENLEEGKRVELDGDRAYCTSFTYETIPEKEGFFEAHLKYLDIHIMLSGKERVDIAPPGELNQTKAEPENDFYAYDGEPWHSLILKPGEFLVVFPEDAHRIKLQVEGPQTVTKAVFKVLIA